MTHPIHSTPHTTSLTAFPFTGEVEVTFTNGNRSFTVRPGEAAPELLAIQRTFQVRQWAVISAANPHGLSINAPENERRHGQLLAATVAEHLPVIEVELRWQGYEPKLRALWIGGIPLHQAQELARDFAQTKLLYGDSERAPAIETCGALTFEI